ncbi:nucleoside monophosphate kinase, partial [Candidatus Saccharibacteria bacterium]|nr:nucleoside monophosphate kinase [Candidatus Saccharibacteria bacterium]
TILMNDKLQAIKNWLGMGRINIFGLPMSGKDTVGVRLAEDISARFLSSGMIIRDMEKEIKNDMTGNGELIPTDLFYEWILPYFFRDDLKENALVLSSVGRWSGEENEVMDSAKTSGHEIKAAVLLDVTETEVMKRWEIVNSLGDEARTVREDDKNPETFKVRIKEFNEKTKPVLDHYEELNLLIRVDGNQDREAVYQATIDALYNFTQK